MAKTRDFPVPNESTLNNEGNTKSRPVRSTRNANPRYTFPDPPKRSKYEYYCKTKTTRVGSGKESRSRERVGKKRLPPPRRLTMRQREVIYNFLREVLTSPSRYCVEVRTPLQKMQLLKNDLFEFLKRRFGAGAVTSFDVEHWLRDCEFVKMLETVIPIQIEVDSSSTIIRTQGAGKNVEDLSMETENSEYSESLETESDSDDLAWESESSNSEDLESESESEHRQHRKFKGTKGDAISNKVTDPTVPMNTAATTTPHGTEESNRSQSNETTCPNVLHGRSSTSQPTLTDLINSKDLGTFSGIMNDHLRSFEADPTHLSLQNALEAGNASASKGKAYSTLSSSIVHAPPTKKTELRESPTTSNRTEAIKRNSTTESELNSRSDRAPPNSNSIPDSEVGIHPVFQLCDNNWSTAMETKRHLQSTGGFTSQRPSSHVPVKKTQHEFTGHEQSGSRFPFNEDIRNSSSAFTNGRSSPTNNLVPYSSSESGDSCVSTTENVHTSRVITSKVQSSIDDIKSSFQVMRSSIQVARENLSAVQLPAPFKNNIPRPPHSNITTNSEEQLITALLDHEVGIFLQGIHQDMKSLKERLHRMIRKRRYHKSMDVIQEVLHVWNASAQHVKLPASFSTN